MAASTTSVSEKTVATTPARVRLEYLDGLRGLAALYVVLSHIYQILRFGPGGAGLPPLLMKPLYVFNFGHYAVDVFIVLSGYVLMLPIARSAEGQFRGGVRDYFQRRARRILPPYYAALGLTLLLTLLPFAQAVTKSSYAATPRTTLAHLFLLNNLRYEWSLQLNTPLWSVATEWHIYFLLPFLLLPVWRRFGLLATVLTGFIVGLAPHFLLPGLVEQACYWFVGLFALGMAGAVIGFTEKQTFLRERIPWGTLSILLWAGLAVMGVAWSQWSRDYLWVVDTMVGLASITLILACTRHLTRGHSASQSLVLRVLDSRWAVALGAFSYSLYLIHYPLLKQLGGALHFLPLSPLVRDVLLIAGVTPLLVFLAYLFHLAFERRFLPGHLRQGSSRQ